MTAYRCLILSSEGRPDWRTVEALSERAAVAQLTADGVTPIDVRSGAPTLAERLNRPVRFGSRLGLAEKALLLTQLAMLVRSGLAVDRSLDLLRDQAPRAGQREVLTQALAKVRSGHGLSRALDEAGVFPGYVIGVIRSAERSGRLGDALTTLAERMNAAASTRRQLVTALSYPAAILAATVIALLLVLVVVVPQFEPVFEGEEARLPVLTKTVLWLSNVATDQGMFVLGGIALRRSAKKPISSFEELRAIFAIAAPGRDICIERHFTLFSGLGKPQPSSGPVPIAPGTPVRIELRVAGGPALTAWLRITGLLDQPHSILAYRRQPVCG